MKPILKNLDLTKNLDLFVFVMIISFMLILFPLQKSYETRMGDIREQVNIPKIGFLTVGDKFQVTLTITNNYTETKYFKIVELFRPYQITGSYTGDRWEDDPVITANSTVQIQHNFTAVFPELWTLQVRAEGFDNSTRLGIVDPSYENDTDYYIHPSSDQDIRVLAQSTQESAKAVENEFGIIAGTAIATVVLAGATGALAYFTRQQFVQTREEIQSRLRPWIGANENLRFETASQLVFPYTNYGQLPTSGIKAQFLISGTKITRKDLHMSSVIQTLDLGTIMPTMKQDLRMPVTAEQYNYASSGHEFYVGIRIPYSYGKVKNGEYGVIYYYNYANKLFYISEEWTDMNELLVENTKSPTNQHVGKLESPITEKPKSSPLERVVTEDIVILDENYKKSVNVKVDQPIKIGMTIKNNQDVAQHFAYLVQVKDVEGGTVNLLSVSGLLSPWQSLQPLVVWIPKSAGKYVIQIFVWETIDSPSALTPPRTIEITIS